MKNLEDFIKATKVISEEFKSSGKLKEYENITDVLKTCWTTTSEALEMILEVFDEISEPSKKELSLDAKELLSQIYQDARKLLNR